MKTITITVIGAAIILSACAQTQPRCTGIDSACSGGGYSARAAAPSKPAAGKPIGISKPTPSKPGHGKGDKNHAPTGQKGKK